ncbi:hypothetical protein BDV93DRAFT_202666 [Ceratobasidium sp. AG-I]|nr:hypothetical protein BDV93DRAFT_202666 [Ceratobasidium sp. AG-I]
MATVQTAPGLPLSLPSHRSRFLVSASSLRLPHAPPSALSAGTQSSSGSDSGYVSSRKRFSPVSVTHTTILGPAAHTTHVVSLGTVDLGAVLRHAANTRTPLELVRPRTPEPDEPEPAAKDTRERPRYRVPTSLASPRLKSGSRTSRPAPISYVRPRAQFPLYLPILDSRVPPVQLPSLESLDAAAAAQTLISPNTTEGRRSARARRPASRTLEYLSSEAVTPVSVPPSRKRRAGADSTGNGNIGNEKRELRTSKRARKDVNYVIPSLASIDRETMPPRRRRRSETSLSEESERPKAVDVEMKDKEDSPLSVDDDAKPSGRKPSRARQAKLD